MQKHEVRRKRFEKMVKYLKKAYPTPKTELLYETPFQLVVAVMLSAQCTDTMVNTVTADIFKKYKTPHDFARADIALLTKEISRVSFFRTKARHIMQAAEIVSDDFSGLVPRRAEDLQKLPGVGYKTAHVVLGELYEIWDGIPTDTHVRRFARKFDLTEKSDLSKISKDLESLAPKKVWKYINNGLVLYGRYVCKAQQHDCAQHPLTKLWPPAKSRWPRARTE